MNPPVSHNPLHQGIRPPPGGSAVTKTSFSTIIELIAAVSPIMVVFFIIMISIFNQNAKGIVYLAGLLLAISTNVLIVRSAKEKYPIDQNQGTCRIFDFPDYIENQHSSVNSLVLMFTSIYIIAPMFILEEGLPNISVIISMISFYIIDLVMNVYKKCSTRRGILIGTFVGAFFGCCWFAIFNASNKNLLFFQELIGENYYCNKPTKQSFKCGVYKNGELIGKG